jgi:putative membrane protein
VSSPALAIAAAAGTVAAVVHGWMFLQESVLFTRPATQRMLEVAPQHASAVRLWAYHQGVYNLLLGLTALAGAGGLLIGAAPVAQTMIVTAGVSMVVAAVALLLVDPRRRRLPGFLAQALPALVALTCLVAGSSG